MKEERARVLVAMSGGVDSSVAAMLLKRRGFDVLGVSMQVWNYRQNGGSAKRASCCAPSDFADARGVAAVLGVPYYVFDFEKTFKDEVIDPFVAAYYAGQTPNPCVECNQKVKFRALRERAKKLGCEVVATGHYARIIKDDQGYHLFRGSDRDKDQSYFLYGLRAEELEYTFFPVGELTKAKVRALAREAGLVTAEKAESQDICFVSGKVQDFLVQIEKRAPAGGPILTAAGKKVGEHRGIHNFTVGQRRGIKLGGAADPLYVTEIDAERNAIIVGRKPDLERESFEVVDAHWLAPIILSRIKEDGYPLCFSGMVQVRHRHAGVPARALVRGDGSVRVEFLDARPVVSPGQAAVFYDAKNEEVLGGGRIAAYAYPRVRVENL